MLFFYFTFVTTAIIFQVSSLKRVQSIHDLQYDSFSWNLKINNFNHCIYNLLPYNSLQIQSKLQYINFT